MTMSLAGTVALKADKVVDGKAVPMYELDGTWDEAKATWTGDMRAPRWHGIWSYTVSGKLLAGTAMDVPTKKVFRKIEARKE